MNGSTVKMLLIAGGFFVVFLLMARGPGSRGGHGGHRHGASHGDDQDVHDGHEGHGTPAEELPRTKAGGCH